MRTDVHLDYAQPFTFELEESTLAFTGVEWEPDETHEVSESGNSTEAAADVSQNDLGYFMNLAGRYPLLRADEERELGMALWAGRRRLLRALRGLDSDADVVPHRRPITASSRRRLARVEERAREIAAGTPSPLADRLAELLREIDGARRVLVERNLRLVVWVAKKFRGRGFDFIDLIQEGGLGLMRATDRYDPAVGARFSTFATHWIQQGIRRALAERARTIRIPVNRIPEVRETIAARARLAEELGRAARPEEIAAELGAPLHKVEELLPAIAPIESIDAPIPSTDRHLIDTLEERRRPSPLDEAMEEETRRAVASVLNELPDRQRVILSMRHGIGYPKECTLEEIGDALGLSRERIRQVEKVATAAVRKWILEHRRELAQPV